MAIPHAKPGEVIDVRPLGTVQAGKRTIVLVKTETLEIIRLVIPRGKEIPSHATQGEITIQCLDGRVGLTTSGFECELGSGEMLYLRGGQSHSLRGIDDATVLLTITFPRSSSAPGWSNQQEPTESPSPAVSELARGRGGRVDFDASATMDLVDQASQESFPASDTPGFIYCDAPEQHEADTSNDQKRSREDN